MSSFVYFLCAATSILCASLLLREYLRHATRLLLWSSISFVIFAISNALMFADLVILPSVDLSLFRSVTALVAAAVLVAGLVWEAE